MSSKNPASAPGNHRGQTTGTNLNLNIFNAVHNDFMPGRSTHSAAARSNPGVIPNAGTGRLFSGHSPPFRIEISESYSVLKQKKGRNRSIRPLLFTRFQPVHARKRKSRFRCARFPANPNRERCYSACWWQTLCEWYRVRPPPDPWHQ